MYSVYLDQIPGSSGFGGWSIIDPAGKVVDEGYTEEGAKQLVERLNAREHGGQDASVE